MYMHTLARFCESQRRFSLFSPLNIYISLFFVLSLLPACCRDPLLRSPGAWPSAPFSPPFLLSCSCRVIRGCRVSSGVSPSASPSPWLVPSCRLGVHPIGRAPKLSGGLLCVVPWVPWLPSLVRYQAQNAMTVGADAARIYPRPCLLLPMCCRVSRWLFRGFRPSVRVCVLLPCVVWWQ